MFYASLLLLPLSESSGHEAASYSGFSCSPHMLDPGGSNLMNQHYRQCQKEQEPMLLQSHASNTL